MIPVGLIFLWPGTAASIPSGWERETTLDSIFLKGAVDDTNQNVSGGASEHSHTTAANHTHSLIAHTHSVSVAGSAGEREGTEDKSGNTSSQGHTHTGSVTSTTDGSLSSQSAVYALTSNNPPYYEFIFIKPSSAVEGIPNLSLAFCSDGSFANNTGKWSGFYACDGNNSTPSVADKFPKGCTGDAGTTGGSSTNTHTLTHGHTATAHRHNITLNASTDSGKDSDTDSSDNVIKTHGHTGESDGTTDTVSSNPSLVTAEVVEPLYKKLLAIQNRSGSQTSPMGIIGMWLGAITNIPGGWLFCNGDSGTQDMRGYYVKLTATAGDIGDTGGSNTHTHASQTHTHSALGTHTHTDSVAHVGSVDRDGTTAHVWIDKPAATHSITLNAATAFYSQDSTSASSSSNEPLYRQVAFLEYSSLEIEESESISVTDSDAVTQAYSISGTDSVTVSEWDDENIRDGVSVHIWKERVTVTDVPEMPGEKGLGNQFEDVTVTESITVKLASESDEAYKPHFKVSE